MCFHVFWLKAWFFEDLFPAEGLSGGPHITMLLDGRLTGLKAIHYQKAPSFLGGLLFWDSWNSEPRRTLSEY